MQVGGRAGFADLVEQAVGQFEQVVVLGVDDGIADAMAVLPGQAVEAVAVLDVAFVEGAQAGLSWSTVLKKRDSYRAAFDNFDIARIAAYDDAKVAELLANPGIVRNRLKIASAIRNAKVALELQREFGSLSAALWQFVGGKPKKNAWKSISEIPASTPESDAMSKFLIKRGMNFVGPTICYAFMQAVGMANDHTVDCFRVSEV